MKTLPAFAFIAALVAFLVLPFSFVVGGSLLFAAGLATIVLHDYARPLVLLRVAAKTAVATPTRTERFGLAA